MNLYSFRENFIAMVEREVDDMPDACANIYKLYNNSNSK